jgi:molybdopterin converting factor small subunit
MGSEATVTVHVPSALRKYCAGAADLPLSAASVRAALDELERNHPSLYRNLCDETGSVRRHLNVFVNSSHVRDRDGLDTALAPGDVVTILAAVSGG